jgi:hypothetical protein
MRKANTPASMMKSTEEEVTYMAEQTSCDRCYLTDKFPGIHFNSSGVCNYCERAMSDEYQASIREQFALTRVGELKDLAKEIKSEAVKRNSKYDCIIGASGGFDSTYVLYVARKLMELNPLVVKYDNGLSHPLANQNLENACRILGADLRIIPFNKHERGYLVNATKSLANLGVFFTGCFSCHYVVPSMVYKTARDENVSYILTGNNFVEDEADKFSHPFKLKALFRNFFGCGIRGMLSALYYQILAQVSFARLKLQVDGFSLRFFRNLPRRVAVHPATVTNINVGEYIGWDYFGILKTMSEELEWKSPLPSKVPLFRWDCRYGALRDRSCKDTVGIADHSTLYNWFVQTGLVSKEDVAEEMRYLEDDHRIHEEMQKVHEELGIRGR